MTLVERVLRGTSSTHLCTMPTRSSPILSCSLPKANSMVILSFPTLLLPFWLAVLFRCYYGISQNSKTEIKESISSSGAETLLILQMKSRRIRMLRSMAPVNSITNVSRRAMPVLYISTTPPRQQESRLKKRRIEKRGITYLEGPPIW